MTHYNEEELEMYRHGEMSVLGRISCTAHLKCCPKCATTLKKLKSDDQFLHTLRASVKIFAQLSPPAAATTTR